MKDLMKARNALGLGAYTCVLCRGEDMYTSNRRGVSPLVTFYEGEKDFCDFSAADKVVGRGAAFLYVLLGVHAVYADVISRAALEVLEGNGIYVEYGTLVENIINRRGDGICPFEEAVLKICDKDEAYVAIKDKMQEMNL